MDIYITSWKRPQFTEQTINMFHERTKPGTFKIHVLDNESDDRTQAVLLKCLQDKRIESLLLHNVNTKCLWGKAVYHAMTNSNQPYYIVSDNDVHPPKMEGKDWLERLTETMEAQRELAFLTAQLPPVQFQSPYEKNGDVVYCKAVGNTLKVVRRSAFPFGLYEQNMTSYGDDSMVCDLVHEKGWKVAYHKEVFCWHAGQTENWGYEPDEIDKDPRKAGYGAPYKYTPVDADTFESPADLQV